MTADMGNLPIHTIYKAGWFCLLYDDEGILNPTLILVLKATILRGWEYLYQNDLPIAKLCTKSNSNQKLHWKTWKWNFIDLSDSCELIFKVNLAYSAQLTSARKNSLIKFLNLINVRNGLVREEENLSLNWKNVGGL